MFSKLKQYILKKKFNTSLLKFTKNRAVSQKEVLSIGILTTDKISSKIEIQNEVEKLLIVRNTKMASFREFDKLDAISYKHFSKNDINWQGKFTEQTLQSFLEQPFDLLIGYFNTNNLYLEMAVLQSKATFKAGFSEVNSDLYELEIAGNPKDIHQFLSELKKYLQSLKKLKN
jgi:acetolactate synthase small subunit